MQTETVLRQALAERVRPVLFINKLDRSIMEKQLTPEELYLDLRRVVERTNAVVATYRPDDCPMGDLNVSLLKHPFNLPVQIP